MTEITRVAKKGRFGTFAPISLLRGDVLSAVYLFDPTYRKAFGKVLGELPTYLKHACCCCDSDDVSDVHDFYRIYAHVVVKDYRGNGMRGQKCVVCKKCLRDCVVDDVYGICATMRATVNSLFAFDVPYDLIKKHVRKIRRGFDITMDRHLVVTLSLDEHNKTIQRFQLQMTKEDPTAILENELSFRYDNTCLN